MATRAETLPRTRKAQYRKAQDRSGTGGKRKLAAKKGKGRASTPGWLFLWPLLVGIAATPFTVHYAEILPLLGNTGLFRLRLLYPFAMLAHQPQLGLQDAAADTVAQAMMYAQFPLYGLIMAMVLRHFGLLRALFAVLVVHALAFAAVWLFAQL